mmetsp:Transcript_20607/g.43108  ORF Transcript_20607/g.43108 Transcript_20607/m.43108 type:complete len:411 (+) Transcript_20607:429-1661(+)
MGCRLVHGQFADGGHHLSRHIFDPRLECVHLLREIHGTLSSIQGLTSELLRESCHLFQDQLLLQEGLFLVVEPLLKVQDLHSQGLLIKVLPTKSSPLSQRALRILQLSGKVFTVFAHVGDLLSEVHHFIGQRLHLRNLPTDYLQLPMDLKKVDLQTSDFLLLSLHRILALLQELLLDVGLFPQDAQLIVAVDQLSAREVAHLNGLFILKPQLDHLFLDGGDDGIQLVDFNHELLHLFIQRHALATDSRLLILKLVMGHFQALCLLPDLGQLFVLHSTLHAQNLDFIREDLELLLHLGELLIRLLDVSHVLIALILDHLVHGAELFLLLADFLMLLLQVLLLQFFHCHLIRGLPVQPVGLRSIPCQLLSMRRQRLEIGVPPLFLDLQSLDLFLHLFHLLIDGLIFLLFVLL